MASLAHQLSTNCQPLSYRREAPVWGEASLAMGREQAAIAVPIVSRPRRGMISRLGALLRLWAQRMRDRTELARLDDRDLRDIGLSRADVAYLVAKPFWRE